MHGLQLCSGVEGETQAKPYLQLELSVTRKFLTKKRREKEGVANPFGRIVDYEDRSYSF